jgi:uncharacterized protein YndB with AHSA1/START domain
MTTTTLPYQLDRILTIGASPDTVFSFFTDSARWASWWGAGSTIDPQLGGSVRIVHPGGAEVIGEILDLQPPERIVFTYGYISGTPIPPGASRVTIRVSSHAEGAQLHLTHEFADDARRQEFVQGWRFQLALFANAVSNLVHADAATVVDGWFAAWNEADPATRLRLLAGVTTGDVRFCDKFSRLDGMAEVDAHLEAARRFMPGVALTRDGSVRHCQGSALANWVAVKDDTQVASGTNQFTLAPDGRIRAVTGFWS